MTGSASGKSHGFVAHPEAARVDAVGRYGILEGPVDGMFAGITSLAARLFDVPIAAVTAVDTDRVWFTSRHGLPEIPQVPREPGFCASAILQADPWIVNDASLDPRTVANLLVAGGFGLRFYAGVPLTTSDGFNLGTLCVIDREPRQVTDDEVATLRALAGVVVDALELRRAASVVVQQEHELRRQAEALATALQASMLPPTPPPLPGMEVASRYQPGERGLEVGGDFYDVFRLAPNDWGVIVGDVCGKGARAASLTALARWTIRAAARHSFLPAAVLSELNATLLAHTDIPDEDHFCSAVFARMELDTCGAWVTLASAGHPRPVVVRRAGWIDTRGHVGLPLGMFGDAAPADDRVGLGPGDALVIFTDGITEARNAEGELFGDEVMLEVLLDCCGLTAEAAADRLVGAAGEFAHGRLRDDVALIVVRVPEDATVDPVGRVTRATGLPAGELNLPGYPLGDVQPDLWRRPPEPPREARIRLAPEPASAAAARRLLGRLLQSWRLDALADGDIGLLVSEVATNAIVHAGTTFTVVVRYLGPVVRVEVGDGSPEAPVRKPVPDDDLHGRGLSIVELVASAWGVIPTRTGKRVWFEVGVGPG